MEGIWKTEVSEHLYYARGQKMWKEFCEKDGILITYTDTDVCFEDCKTAEAILLKNNGEIIHTNFDDEKN